MRIDDSEHDEQRMLGTCNNIIYFCCCLWWLVIKLAQFSSFGKYYYQHRFCATVRLMRACFTASHVYTQRQTALALTHTRTRTRTQQSTLIALHMCTDVRFQGHALHSGTSQRFRRNQSARAGTSVGPRTKDGCVCAVR